MLPTQTTQTAQNYHAHNTNVLIFFHIIISLVNLYRFAKKIDTPTLTHFWEMFWFFFVLWFVFPISIDIPKTLWPRPSYTLHLIPKIWLQNGQFTRTRCIWMYLHVGLVKQGANRFSWCPSHSGSTFLVWYGFSTLLSKSYEIFRWPFDYTLYL